MRRKERIREGELTQAEKEKLVVFHEKQGLDKTLSESERNGV